MGLINYAKQELDLINMREDGDEMDRKMRHDVIELVKLFASQGHSGMSASVCIHAFGKIASLEPLSPLQGTEDEWDEPRSGMSQNKRYSCVFRREEDGSCWNIRGKVFIGTDGVPFTSKDSVKYIEEFPYTPEVEYVHLTENDERSP